MYLFFFLDSLVKITTLEPVIYLKEGDNTRLKCEVTTEVSEDVKLRWYNMNDKEVTSSNVNEDAFIAPPGKNQLTLFVRGLFKQAGEWSCKATVAGVTHEDKKRIEIYAGITFDGCEKYQFPQEGMYSLSLYLFSGHSVKSNFVTEYNFSRLLNSFN